MKFDEDIKLFEEADEALTSEEENLELEPSDDRFKEPKNYVPMVQLVLCVMALIGIVVMKYVDSDRYNQVVTWYKTEISRTIELPKFVRQKSDLSSVTPTLDGSSLAQPETEKEAQISISSDQAKAI